MPLFPVWAYPDLIARKQLTRTSFLLACWECWGQIVWVVSDDITVDVSGLTLRESLVSVSNHWSGLYDFMLLNMLYKFALYLTSLFLLVWFKRFCGEKIPYRMIYIQLVWTFWEFKEVVLDWRFISDVN